MTEIFCRVPTAPETVAEHDKKCDPDRYTLFPLSLFEETVDILERRGIRFIRYRDIDPFLIRPGRKIFYIFEYAAFLNGKPNFLSTIITLITIKLERISFNKTTKRFSKNRCQPSCVFMQHDADRQPQKTVKIMQYEKKQGVISNNYFFRRRHLCDNDYEPYMIDISSLKDLEKAGFEIGYHLNAYELANYDVYLAKKISEEDVEWFKKHFHLKSFVPHGGQQGVNGLNNNNMPLSRSLKKLICAYNGKGLNVITGYNWSDGGPTKKKPIDPRVFAKKIPKYGARARILMHPQYYGARLGFRHWEYLPIAKEDWWRRLWKV